MHTTASPAMESAYEHELLRRNYLRSHGGIRHYNNSEALADLYLSERRHSLGVEAQMGFQPRYLYKRERQPSLDESLNSLLPAEILEDDERQQQTSINTVKVVQNLTLVGRFLEMLLSLPLPRLNFTTFSLCLLVVTFIAPRSCSQNILFPAFRLTFGNLYPAYASYKAVRTKDVKLYVKWMMYWIVFAFFTCIETITDIFLSWFPFYYEVKVIIVIWLLSPATKGSSTLYRKFVHPMLTSREQEIDEYINQAKERGYSAVLQLGSKGVNYATNVIMQTALKGGGNLVQTIRRSYSLSDLSEPDVQLTREETDGMSAVMRPHQQRHLRPRMHTPVGRSASGTRHSTGMYFTEIDMKTAGDFNYNVRSSDDISSGYSSTAEPTSGLSRTSSMTNASKTRLRAKRNEVHNSEPMPRNYYIPTDYSKDWEDTLGMGLPAKRTLRDYLGATPSIAHAPVTDFDDILLRGVGINGSEIPTGYIDERNLDSHYSNTDFKPLKVTTPTMRMPTEYSKDWGDTWGFDFATTNINSRPHQWARTTAGNRNPLSDVSEILNSSSLPSTVDAAVVRDEPTGLVDADKYEEVHSDDDDEFLETMSAHSREAEEDFDDCVSASLEVTKEEDKANLSPENEGSAFKSETTEDESKEFVSSFNMDTTKSTVGLNIDASGVSSTSQSSTRSSPSMSKKVSPRELQAALKEIARDFRATMETRASTQESDIDQDASSETQLGKRALLHNKGKAPAPPAPATPPTPQVPARSTRPSMKTAAEKELEADWDALPSSASSSSLEPKQQRKSLFSNIRTNLFRSNNTGTKESHANDFLKETEI